MILVMKYTGRSKGFARPVVYLFYRIQTNFKYKKWVSFEVFKKPTDIVI